MDQKLCRTARLSTQLVVASKQTSLPALIHKCTVSFERSRYQAGYNLISGQSQFLYVQVFEEVMGQTADLLDLQKILNKSESKLSNAAQQNMTRWAVWQACVLLRRHKAEHERLMEAMNKGLSIADCVKAIESAA